MSMHYRITTGSNLLETSDAAPTVKVTNSANCPCAELQVMLKTLKFEKKA